MGRHLWIGILFLLSATSTLAQTCATSNARPIDADVAFLAYWEVIEVSWAAIAAVGKRDLLHLPLEKRDLVCASAEQCLSFKGYPFCDNASTHTFHTAEGTTGNFVTGDYTLADGRQGNMYHGPYPTNTVLAAAATQTENTATATMSSASVTGTSDVGTPVSSAGPSASHAGVSAVSTATVMPKQSSSIILKSDGSWTKVSSHSLGSIIMLLGFLLYL